ncbi:MAG: hypothetical protein AAGN35_03410 [Bacteroidota bacterium]
MHSFRTTIYLLITFFTVAAAGIVYGQQEWTPPSGISLDKKAYGVKAGEEKYCRPLQRYEYAAIHLADYVVRQGDSLFLRYADLARLEAMFTKGKDGLAVDIVTQDQFPCDGPNRVHASPHHDGVLLPPVYKKKLFKANRRAKQGKAYLFLGLVPPEMKGDLNYNLLVLQKKRVCKYSYPLSPPTTELRPLRVVPAWETVPFSPLVRDQRRRLDFVVPFEKEKYEYQLEDVRPMLDSVEALGREITRIDIKAYASVEGSLELNRHLYTKRAESMYDAIQSQQKSRILLSQQAYENWTDFRVDILETRYARLLRYTHQQIKDSLRMNPRMLAELEPMLAPHRRAEIQIFLAESWMDTLSGKEALARYKRSMEMGLADSALFYQSMLIRSFDQGELLREVLLRTEIPIRKGMSPLHANRFNMAMQIGDPDYVNWYLGKADSIWDFAADCPGLRALYMDWRIRNLYQNPGSHKRLPFDYLQDLELIERDGYNTLLLNRMRFNYHLGAIKWNAMKGKTGAVGNSLKAIRGQYEKAQLDAEEFVELGKFFNLYSKTEWTMEMLERFARADDPEPELLFQFLQAAYLHAEKADTGLLTALSHKAKQLDQRRMCSLYRTNFQLARYDWLRPILCEACDSSN